MININTSQINYSEIIIEVINNLFSTLISSIDNSIYSLIDKTVFIDANIMKDSFFNNLLNSQFGLTYIANSILIGFVLYYCAKLMFSHYSGISIEHPYQFLIKTILCAIFINSSYFVCEQILNINALISSSIAELGSSFFGQEVSFNNLITQTNVFIRNSSAIDMFSFAGILKSFITFGLLNLLFSYSIRYILIKVFILITPFAILSLTTQSSSWFFRSWFKNFLSLLLVQSLISLILLIIFSLNTKSGNIMSQISYISAIFVLTKANNYMKDLFGGISTDFNVSISALKSLMK